jgi:2'-5' RNA ligase
MRELDADDPRIVISDKTYVGLKAQGMGFDAHLTVHCLGKISILQERLAVTVINNWLDFSNGIYFVERMGIELFGPVNDIPVVKVGLINDDLFELNRKFKQHSYLPDPSEFEWNPHITLNLKSNETIRIPKIIKLTDLGLY